MTACKLCSQYGGISQFQWIWIIVHYLPTSDLARFMTIFSNNFSRNDSWPKSQIHVANSRDIILTFSKFSIWPNPTWNISIFLGLEISGKNQSIILSLNNLRFPNCLFTSSWLFKLVTWNNSRFHSIPNYSSTSSWSVKLVTSNTSRKMS